MNYTVYIHEKSSGWVVMPGSFVFPFSWAEKLDESLDECQFVCYNSLVKKYTPNTNFKVEISDGTSSKTFLFKLANDSSEEYPNGSGRYKHTISLVEMTKYLEGVMCQTLTFTNSLAFSYAEVSAINHFDGFYKDELKEAPALTASDFPSSSRPVSPKGLKNPFVISPKNFGEVVAANINNNNKTTDPVAYFPKEGGTSPKRSYVAYSFGNEQIRYVYENDSVSFLISDETDPIFMTAYLVIDTASGSGQPEYTEIHFDPIRVVSEDNSKKWTIASVCNRIFQLCEPLFGNETPRFSLRTSDAEELDKIIAPEFTMSQSTLREQLRVVGGRIHSEPRIVDIAWENNRFNYVIGFDYYSRQAVDTLPAGYLKKSYSFDLANYCTRIYTNARNVVSSLNNGMTIADPGKTAYKGLRAEQINVRISDANAIVQTAEPIYDILAVKCGIFNYNGTSDADRIKLAPVDITAFCFEATIYDSVLSSYDGSYPRSKTYAIRWKRGEKNITQLFYQAPNAITSAFSTQSIVNILSAVQSTLTKYQIEELLTATDHDIANQLVFQVQYKPVTNTAFFHGKNESTEDEPFTIAYNQSDSLVELDYYGENIRGAAARLGNAEAAVTAVFKNIADLPHIGYRTKIDGDEYFISQITYNLDPHQIMATMGLTKDFNRISQYIGVDSRKRISEIATEQTYDRDIVLEAKLILGTLPESWTSKIDVPIDRFSHIFDARPGTERISQCVIYRDDGKNRVCLPAISSGYGCTTVLTTSMKDNYSAGDAERYYSDGTIKGFWGYDLPFGDYFGRANKITISFASDAEYGVDFAFAYPATTKTTFPYGDIRATDYVVLKDNRERFSTIAVAIEAQTTIDGVTLGSAIAKLNLMVSSDTRIPHLYIVPSGSELPYKLDDSIIDYDRTGWVDAGEVSSVLDTAKNTFYLPSKTVTASGIGFVIAFPVTTKTEQVVDVSGAIVEQTIYEGGEIILINSNPVTPGTLLGEEYSFRIE